MYLRELQSLVVSLDRSGRFIVFLSSLSRHCSQGLVSQMWKYVLVQDLSRKQRRL